MTAEDNSTEWQLEPLDLFVSNGSFNEESNNASILGDCVTLDDYMVNTYQDLTGNTTVRASFFAMYALVFLLGITGNCLVVLAVVRNSTLQTVRNFFLVNLSASDIVVCLTSLPVTPYTIMFKNWSFGKILCYAIPLVQGMSVIISTLTLTAIAVDRFILIVYPTSRPLQKSHAFTMIMSTWAIAIALTMPMVINYKLVEGVEFHLDNRPVCGVFCEELGWAGNNRMWYGMCVLILQFFVPVGIISFCYIRISLTLERGLGVRVAQARYRRSSSHSSSSLGHHHIAAIRRKTRTNRMLILMVCLFALVWFPQVLLNLLRDFEQLPAFVVEQHYLFALMVHFLAMTSTVWNPILYGGLNETFREAFIELNPYKLIVKFIVKWQGRKVSSGSAVNGAQISNQIHDNLSSIRMDARRALIAETTSLLLSQLRTVGTVKPQLIVESTAMSQLNAFNDSD